MKTIFLVLVMIGMSFGWTARIDSAHIKRGVKIDSGLTVGKTVECDKVIADTVNALVELVTDSINNTGGYNGVNGTFSEAVRCDSFYYKNGGAYKSLSTTTSGPAFVYCNHNSDTAWGTFEYTVIAGKLFNFFFVPDSSLSYDGGSNSFAFKIPSGGPYWINGPFTIPVLIQQAGIGNGGWEDGYLRYIAGHISNEVYRNAGEPFATAPINMRLDFTGKLP